MAKQDQAPLPPVLNYDDVVIGYRFPRARLTIGAEQVAALARCLALPTASFHETGIPRLADGRPVVPTFLLNEFFSFKRHLRIPSGTLHAQERIRRFSPVYVDQPLHVDIVASDKFEKNGRRFVIIDQFVSAARDSNLALAIRRTFAWAD